MEQGVQPSRKRARWRVLVGVICALLLLITLFTGAPESLLLRVRLLNTAAPDFTLANQQGTPFHLKDLRGHPVALNFWYAACDGCRAEAPTLQRVSHRYSSTGFVLVGINTVDTAQQVQTYVHDFGVTYPIVFDANQATAQRYHVTAIPTTVFLDAHGIIRATAVGVLDEAALVHDMQATGVCITC